MDNIKTRDREIFLKMVRKIIKDVNLLGATSKSKEWMRYKIKVLKEVFNN